DRRPLLGVRQNPPLLRDLRTRGRRRLIFFARLMQAGSRFRIVLKRREPESSHDSLTRPNRRGLLERFATPIGRGAQGLPRPRLGTGPRFPPAVGEALAAPPKGR